MKRTLRITAQQSDWLAAAVAEARRAQQVADAIFMTLLRGAGIRGGAALLALDGPRLTVELPDRVKVEPSNSPIAATRNARPMTSTGPRPPVKSRDGRPETYLPVPDRR